MILKSKTTVSWTDFMCVLSGVRLFTTPGTVGRQALLSMGFSRLEHWSGLPFPSPGGLPDPGMETLLSSLSCAGRKIFTTEPPGTPSTISSQI